MNSKTNLKKFFLCIFSVVSISFMHAQTEIGGKVTDANNEPLFGANVLVKGTTTGVATDEDGTFSLSTNEAPPLTLLISYTGFTTQEITIEGNTTDLSISLEEAGYIIDEVVVSASRKPEKVQNAPAAIGIISAKKIANDAVGDPFLSVRNMVGVDVAQTGVGNGNITLRGRSAVFQTETFVMLDYRNLVLPGLGTLGYSQQPIDPIDLERIEVVKGPGSALYGPGVEAGIVHFISKSPITHPGTTISVAAGTQSTFQTSIRHAGANEKKSFGYKVLGYYRKAQDWKIDANDPQEAAHLAAFQPEIRSGITGDFVTDKIPDYDTESYGVTGTLEFRPNEKTTITTTGGISVGKYIFRTATGEGYVSAPRPFAQVRMQSGGLFAQAFWSKNNGKDGNTWGYGSGLTTANVADQIEGQLQYNFDVANEKLNLTVGTDYRYNSFDTQGTIHGRFEDEDEYAIFGGYAQGDLAISEKLSLVGAARLDYFNALDETSFSPRLGLVFKPSPKHSFRATFNHSVGAPTAINLYADLPLQNAGAFLIHLLGGANPVTFNNVQTTSFLGGGVYDGVGLPLQVAYGAITAGLEASGSLPQTLVDYLYSEIGNIGGFSNGVQTKDLLPREKLKLSNSDMYELGYKGVIGDKLSVTVDLYHTKRKNVVSAPQVASALVVQPFLPTDIAAEVAATLDPTVLAAYGLSPEAVGGIYEGVAQGIAFDDAGNPGPLGIIRSDQTPSQLALPTYDISYYNIKEISYTGLDIGLQYFFNHNWSVSGSFSYISENLFEDVPVGEAADAPTTNFSLNLPDKKVKFGLDYLPEQGLSGTLSYRYASAWEAINGSPWSGPVDETNIVDAGFGYGFNNGLKLNVTATNLFDSTYRSIYGAPKIGRQVIGKITYSF